MKKYFFVLFLLLLFLPACKREKEKKGETAPQEAWAATSTENSAYIQAYTMDEEENLYTIEFLPNDINAVLYLKQYDPNGVCQKSLTLSAVYPSEVQTMAYANGTLYYAPRCHGKNEVCILYGCDVATWTEREIEELPEIVGVARIVPKGEKLFFLGSAAELRLSHTTVYSYDGRKLFCLDTQTKEIQMIPIAEPIDMADAGEEQILLYTHTEDCFSFLSYDVKKQAVKARSTTGEYILNCFAFWPEKERIIYDCETRDKIVCADLNKPEAASEIYPECDFWGMNLFCLNGRVLTRNHANDLVRITLSASVKETDVIRYVSDQLVESAPYGCGFTLLREQYDLDKLAVKLLAQDADFDICYMNTASGFGRKLKDYGSFYPLNEIPGVEEYLESCLPYVRDAVTDENGMVWMLPIKIDVPVLLYNTEHEAGKVFPFGRDMTYQGFFEAQAGLEEEERKKTEISALPLEAMRGYFSCFRSVDTKEFRKLLTELKKGMGSLGTGMPGLETDYLYRSFFDCENLFREVSVLKKGDVLRAYPYPKLMQGQKNIGRCYGIVVNPKSDRLETTLQYVASLISFISNQETPPLFFRQFVKDENSLRASLYKIYEDTEIYFGIDADLYQGYYEVLEGSLDLEEYISRTETKLRMYFGE